MSDLHYLETFKFALETYFWLKLVILRPINVLELYYDKLGFVLFISPRSTPSIRIVPSYPLSISHQSHQVFLLVLLVLYSSVFLTYQDSTIYILSIAVTISLYSTAVKHFILLTSKYNLESIPLITRLTLLCRQLHYPPGTQDRKRRLVTSATSLFIWRLN